MNKPMILHCCGYTDTSALQWNPYNGVAQCHNCGQVYTSPQPARQPLTNEQIIAIANNARAAESGDAGYILPIAFARAIEAAHGITGEQQGVTEMNVKTQELTGPALDWAVAVAEGYDYDISEQGEVLTGDTIPIVDGDYAGCHEDEIYRPSRDWSQGGPIIEREFIAVWFSKGDWKSQRRDTSNKQHGPTPLIAAMRCLVASKLGDTVEIPEELK